jgi:hypothetical protein
VKNNPATDIYGLTEEQRQKIYDAAEADEAKPITWARDILLRAAKRRSK